MRREKEAVTAILLLTLSAITAQISSNATAESPTGYGPREEDLAIYYYTNAQDVYRALKSGEIDMVLGELPFENPPPPEPPIDDYVWVASFGPDNIENNGLQGRYVGTDDPYNGFGAPNWTGNFTLEDSFASVNTITVHALPLTGDEYTYTLTEGVDYLVHAAEDKIELLHSLDVEIFNEHWVDGVNNTLNGWPFINYVASGIQSVDVDQHLGAGRVPSPNAGYANPPPGDWWYDPDFTCELEGWWALGFFAGPWNWAPGSEWWINYTAASYLTIDYNLETTEPPPINPCQDAIDDPNIITCRVPDSGFYEFDLNNNYTISDYPGIRSPMNYSEMRKAIAFLSDKDYYVGTLMGWKAQRIDQMIAAPYYGWANGSMSYPFYPWEYSPAAAKTMLDSKFPVGTTANPYYDPLDPLSSPYLRRYPVDHPQKAGQDLDPLKFKVRTEPARLQTGRSIYNALREMGVPIDVQEASGTVLYPVVMGDFNYHFYTGSWTVGRFPPMTLYNLFHSANAFPYGTNYVTGNGTHPKLDSLLEDCNYAASYSDAVSACKLAAGYMTEICVNVPLWSSAGYWGWSKDLLGVVNKAGDDPENDYTFMNAYKIDGSPIRCGIAGIPTAMNIVYSNWVYDYSNLDRMNLYGRVDTDAYEMQPQVGFVDYWQTTTWNDGGETKTKMVMSFREDGYFARPVTGGQGENVNASHYFWNAWLDYQIGDGRYSSSFADLHHVDITGPYDFEIYFDTYGYWNSYYCQGPLRPMDTWMAQGPYFINQEIEAFVNPVTPGAIDLNYDPIWIDYVEMDGTPLTMFADYNIVKGDLYIYNALGAGTVEVGYKYVPYTALKGYTPGNLPWQTIFEGAGMYYATDFVPGAGGHLTLKRNPFYWMETPPLGEIDFKRKPSGELAVDIYDMYYAASSNGSQGIYVPDTNWLPGADLFPPGGSIDNFDIAVVSLAAGWGHPEHEVALISSTPLKTEVTSGQLLPINVTIENEGSLSETVPIRIHANCTEVTGASYELNVGEIRTVTVFWDTSGFDGNYMISTFIGPVDASTLDFECDLRDNIILDSSMVTVKPVEHTIVVETPGRKYNLTVESDTTLTSIIATKNALHLDVTGQSGRVAYLKACIPIGLNTTEIKVFVNNVKLTYPPFPIITTNGTHYFVYVEIALSTHSVDVQYVTPEVAVTAVSSSKTIVGQGYTTTFNATAQNLVDQESNFNLTVYADLNSTLLGDETVIGTLNVTLGAFESRLVSLTWNTTGFDKGLYTVSMTADNSVVCGSFFITIPGDNNGDRRVNIFDIVRMAGVYGVEYPDPRYNSVCDIDDDRDIDIFDLVIAAINYGKNW